MPARFDDGLVVRIAAGTVREAQRLCPLYAGATAPLHEGQLLDMIRQAGCGVERWRFRSRRGAFAMEVAGSVEVALNLAVPRPVRLFGARHELHHVFAGDVHDPHGGAVFLGDSGYWTPWERAADLFALADLAPAHLLRHSERVLDEALAAVAAYWPDPDGWTQDRARLRVRLYREFGI